MKADVNWGQNALIRVKMSTTLYMSSAVHVAIWHVQTKQAGAGRPNRSEAEKCVSFNWICLSVTLQGDHVASCHSTFSNQFSKSGIHGGLAEEPGLMCCGGGSFKIIVIQY